MQAFFSGIKGLQSMNPTPEGVLKPSSNPSSSSPSQSAPSQQPITAAEIEKMSLDELASKDLDTLIGQTPVATSTSGTIETIHDISRDEKLEEIQSQLQMVLKLESKFVNNENSVSNERKSSTSGYKKLTSGQKIISFIIIAGITYSMTHIS